MKNVKLYVEGAVDKIIVANILEAAKFPLERIIIEVADGKQNIKRFAKQNYLNNKENDTEITAVLFDTDTTHIPNAIEQIETGFVNTDVKCFCVISEIETWIFADNVLIQEIAKPENKKKLARLPLPEEITFPKLVFSSWLKINNSTNLDAQYAFLKRMNIQRAASRCPSLHYFLKEMANLLEVEVKLQKSIENVHQLSNEIIANLLKEGTKEDMVMFKTLDGYEITARELQTSVMQNTREGKEYAETLLKVARDIIRSQANRNRVKG